MVEISTSTHLAARQQQQPTFQEEMLRHLRSPPPPPRDDAGEGDAATNEDTARAAAVSDQRTIYLVNTFVANTVEFLNSFSALCDDKLARLHRKIVKIDASLTLLEEKLQSIGDTNASEHSTSQKAHQSLGHDERFDR